ncbi:MAG: hypothetical protein JKY67_17855 [Pseudomonadales bacterium]|nr:hypothetical protein [Pseudomonadales bacterium]
MNIQNILDSSLRQKWSVSDFDWDRPVDMQDVSEKQQKNLAYVLLFISGIERVGAEFFRIHADYVDDPIASQLFNVFAEDEERHADAELEMAKRLGAEWHDLPWITRLTFKVVQRDLNNIRKSKYGSGVHRFGSTMILFAELGLDGIVMPTLRNGMNEPLQDEVWKKIDQDERRHIAMDYWLIENRYERNIAFENQTTNNRKLLPQIKNLSFPISLLSAATTPIIAIPGFLMVGRAAASMPVKASFFRDYWELVKNIPKRAPHAPELAAYSAPTNFIRNVSLFVQDSKLINSFARRISSNNKLAPSY